MTVLATARGIAASRLLDLWEEGAARPPAERALLLLRMADPDQDLDALVDLTLGERDRELLLLRACWFGPAVSAVERCPGCGERLELSFTIDDVLVETSARPAPQYETAVDGYEIRFRLPTSGQMVAVAACADVATARMVLLTGCLVEVRRDGDLILTDHLPPHVVAHVDQAMEALDPQANIELDLRCVACARDWPVCFDIVAYLWDEVVAWARQVIKDVHQLAVAYGWSEREILALGPVRRARYLEMAAGG
jgi:hypothetical protein